MNMKKLLYLVAVVGFCGKPSYGMERSADQKQQNECKDCIKVGACQWAHLAVQLGEMHAGNPLQQVSIPMQTREKDQPDCLDAQSAKASVTHSSEAAEDDASETGSLHSWDKPGLPNDDDWVDWDKWDDVDGAEKEKKE
jgi:hypothetical protein